MMESETPPSAAPSGGADDPEVSSRRVSPSPAGPESAAPTGAAGGAEVFAREGIYLRRSPYINEYGE